MRYDSEVYWDRSWQGNNRPLQRPFTIEAITALEQRTRFTPRRRIVELGCGFTTTLRTLAGLHEAPVETVGVDFSKEALAKAAEYHPDGVWELANLEAAAFVTTPVDEQSGSIVFSSHVLEHVADPWVLLDEQWRLTEPGGLMAVVVPLHMYHPEHKHVFTTDAIVGMLKVYGRPVLCYPNGTDSELAAGVVRGTV